MLPFPCEFLAVMGFSCFSHTCPPPPILHPCSRHAPSNGSFPCFFPKPHLPLCFLEQTYASHKAAFSTRVTPSYHMPTPCHCVLLPSFAYPLNTDTFPTQKLHVRVAAQPSCTSLKAQRKREKKSWSAFIY